MRNTILVATDFSEHSEAAARAALSLARRLEARLLCVHACSMSDVHMPAYELDPGQLDELRPMRDKQLVERRVRLERMCDEITHYGVDAEYRLVDGHPARAICTAAQGTDTIMVVMGSHGRTGLKRIMLGSVTERVVRLCDTSVLVVRPPVVGKDGFRHVLVATDFSEIANAALDQAATLAAQDASIDILHCWRMDELASDLLEEGVEPSSAHARLVDDVSRAARRVGEALVHRAASGERQVAFHVAEGWPSAGVQRFIDERSQSYDLVAVGTHGRTGLERLLVGSVAETTVRYAPCSVLVGRPRTE